MGADENAETESKSVETSFQLSDEIEAKLDHGWQIKVTESGQLLLTPPPPYGDAA